MWPDMVEFHSAISANSWRKKKERKKEEESLVKYKSADNYVGQPNKLSSDELISMKFNLPVI